MGRRTTLSWLLRLYPVWWRGRYEEEMNAVLAAHRNSVATGVDLLLGAIDAHLLGDNRVEGAFRMANRMRTSVVLVFCAFMTFGVGWGLLQRLTDPTANFFPVSAAHPILLIAFRALQAAGLIGFLAFLAGGLPVFAIASKRAFTKQLRGVIAPFWIAVLSLVAFLEATGAVALWHPRSHIYVWVIGYPTIVALLLIIGTVSVARVVAKSDFTVRELKRVQLPEWVIAGTMTVAFVAAAILVIVISTAAPQLWTLQDVNSPIFVVGMVMMAIGTLLAYIGLSRSRLDRGDDTAVAAQ